MPYVDSGPTPLDARIKGSPAYHQQEIALDRLFHRLESLEEQVEEREKRLVARIEAYEKKAQALEGDRDKALRWGIGALWAVVLALGGFLVNVVRDFLPKPL